VFSLKDFTVKMKIYRHTNKNKSTVDITQLGARRGLSHKLRGKLPRKKYQSGEEVFSRSFSCSDEKHHIA
jgi:hypothetical protein